MTYNHINYPNYTASIENIITHKNQVNNISVYAHMFDILKLQSTFYSDKLCLYNIGTRTILNQSHTNN